LSETSSDGRTPGDEPASGSPSHPDNAASHPTMFVKTRILSVRMRLCHLMYAVASSRLDCTTSCGGMSPIRSGRQRYPLRMHLPCVLDENSICSVLFCTVDCSAAMMRHQASAPTAQGRRNHDAPERARTLLGLNCRGLVVPDCPLSPFTVRRSVCCGSGTVLFEWAHAATGHAARGHACAAGASTTSSALFARSAPPSLLLRARLPWLCVAGATLLTMATKSRWWCWWARPLRTHPHDPAVRSAPSRRCVARPRRGHCHGRGLRRHRPWQ
jgi:hypothetical protein